MSDSLSGMEDVIRAKNIVKALMEQATSTAGTLPEDAMVLRSFELREKGYVHFNAPSIDILVERYLVVNNEHIFVFDLYLRSGEVVAEVRPYKEWTAPNAGDEITTRVTVDREPKAVKVNLIPQFQSYISPISTDMHAVIKAPGRLVSILH